MGRPIHIYVADGDTQEVRPLTETSSQQHNMWEQNQDKNSHVRMIWRF